MTATQKEAFKNSLAEIFNNIRTIGEFVPVRYNHGSLNALNNISLETLKLQKLVEECQTN